MANGNGGVGAGDHGQVDPQLTVATLSRDTLDPGGIIPVLRPGEAVELQAGRLALRKPAYACCRIECGDNLQSALRHHGCNPASSRQNFAKPERDDIADHPVHRRLDAPLIEFVAQLFDLRDHGRMFSFCCGQTFPRASGLSGAVSPPYQRFADRTGLLMASRFAKRRSTARFGIGLVSFDRGKTTSGGIGPLLLREAAVQVAGHFGFTGAGPCGRSSGGTRLARSRFGIMSGGNLRPKCPGSCFIAGQSRFGFSQTQALRLGIELCQPLTGANLAADVEAARDQPSALLGRNLSRGRNDFDVGGPGDVVNRDAREKEPCHPRRDEAQRNHHRDRCARAVIGAQRPRGP